MLLKDKNKLNKKAFTLIELIVVMAVISILVLLAMPKFMGYTEKARLTDVKNSIKQLENASERYYIDHQEWPRASDTHYTKEELELYAQEIKNKTGAIVTLEEGGKYYPIDYDKLHKYVQKPKNSIQYIIQNPVGDVFYLDDFTEQGKTIFYNNEIENENNPKEPELEPSPEGWFIIDTNGAVKASNILKSLPGPIDLVIPEKINNQTVTDIYIFGFSNLTNLNSVVMPNTVKTIGVNAFSGSSSLKNVVLSDNLVRIGEEAFKDTSGIKTIKIPSTVVTIEKYVFYNWNSTQTILFEPRNNTNVSAGTAWNHGAKVEFEDKDDYFIINSSGAVSKINILEKVSGPIELVIPEQINGQTVTAIDSGGFSSLKNLVSVTMPNTVTSIGLSAFSYDSNLKNIVISDGVKIIRSNAFNQCTGLTELILPSNLITIEESVFSDTTNISTIKIPSTVTSIGRYAFYNWKSHQTIIFVGRSDSKGVTLGYGWSHFATINYQP